MSVSLELVKRLRELSSAPMMECKKALEEARGDLEQAFTLLRKRGKAVAAISVAISRKERFDVFDH